MAELLPDDAERVTDAGIEIVSISELKEGDVVLVRSGARIPADGQVTQGSADVDESMLTGESRPVRKNESDHVTAGMPFLRIPPRDQSRAYLAGLA